MLKNKSIYIKYRSHHFLLSSTRNEVEKVQRKLETSMRAERLKESMLLGMWPLILGNFFKRLHPQPPNPSPAQPSQTDDSTH